MGPTPRSRALTFETTELFMRLEIIQVDVLALVSLVWVALDSYSFAVGAFDDVLVAPMLIKTPPSLLVVFASSLLLSPSRLRIISTSPDHVDGLVSYLFGDHHLSHNGTGVVLLLCEAMSKRQQCCCNGGELHRT